MTYQQARKAIELFEKEYVGQSQRELWEWAVKKVKKEGVNR